LAKEFHKKVENGTVDANYLQKVKNATESFLLEEPKMISLEATYI